MTFSLSSLSAAGPSPRTQMNARISAAVSAGSISTTDQTALSTALDSIDGTLAAARPTGSPASMKDRIDSLVDSQVTAGTLTDDQAVELKQLFAQGAAGTSGATDDTTDDTADVIAAAGGTRGPGGPRGAGGPPPSPPPSDDTSDSDDSSTSGTDATSPTTASSGSAIDQRLLAMEKFLDKLRQSIDANGTYDNGKAPSATTSGLVFNGIA